MNARLIATCFALTLGASASIPASAEEAAAELAWQQPGYVTEVVVVTAPRPKAPEPRTAATDGTLAWQQPGYVEEVVVIKVSRREALAGAARSSEARLPAWRHPFMGTTVR